MAGLDGILRKTDPSKEGFGPFDFNLYSLSEEEQKSIRQLPRTLDEALDALEEDHEFLTADGVFPQALLKNWIMSKRKEAARYNQLPHPVEFDMYYDL